MNKAEKQMVFETLVEGLTVLAGGDKKALERLKLWADDKRKTDVYIDGRVGSWTLERREKHSEMMRRSSPYCYRMEVFSAPAYGGGKLATLHFSTPDEVAVLMGIKTHSLQCMLSGAGGKLVRDINYLSTITEKIPRIPTLEFTKVDVDRRESLVDILNRIGVLDKGQYKVLANVPRGRTRGRPSTKSGAGELPLPGGY